MTWATGGDFSNKKLRYVDLSNSKIVSADMRGASFEGDIDGLSINGIEVAPLIAKEMERLYPERKHLFAETPEGMQKAYDIVFGQLDATIERAQRLSEEQRQERVDDEWSVVETIRHLVFAVDAWIVRTVLGRTEFHQIGLPHSEMTPTPAVTCDPAARPSFEEAVGVWKEREDVLRELLATLTSEELDRPIVTTGDGYPPPGHETKVIGPLWTILEEAWWHNLYMNRDLDTIEAGQDR